MTRPKFRPCPSCQTPNQASRKSCYVCFGSLSTKQKINDKVVSLDSKWGQSVKKSRNVGRIIDSVLHGKTWDDTWEPASEFQHFLPDPNRLSP